MKNIYYFILLIILVSCVSQNQIIKKFQPIKCGHKYKFNVPKGYTYEMRIAGDHEYEQQYYYPDSSVFYVTSSNNTSNYEEIRVQGTYHDRFDALYKGDTLLLKGIDKCGLYWKDRLLESGVTIGYSNVSSNRKNEFDKCVLSIRKLK